MHGLRTIHRLEADRAEAHRLLVEHENREKARLDELERQQAAAAVPLSELLAEEPSRITRNHADIIGK